MDNTFICCADHYFTENPFIYDNPENRSWRACVYETGKFREFAVTVSDAGVITDTSIGGQDSLAQVGCAYMNSSFSFLFRSYMEAEINDFGVSSMFWEEFYGRHIHQLTFYCREFKPGQILEFESVDDLRTFDSEFLLNVDSEIIENITRTLHCTPNDISNIAVINAGLTNALEGWKISYFVHNARNCDFEQNETQLIRGMEMLHQLHVVGVPTSAGVKIFDNVEEAKKLMEIASVTKGHLAKEFKPLIDKIDRLYPAIKADAERLGYGLVLCHNDTYEPNYLYRKLIEFL